MYALYLADDGRILHVTEEKYVTNIKLTKSDDLNAEPTIIPLLESYVLVEAYPDGNVTDYLYMNGEYIYDPIPKEDPEALLCGTN